ncbi:MAG: hypothetical protein Q7T33_10715 [Dehalococcoidia bacterium]|nr:hypothetical protein [Dehalococcoidia bacterium]
MRLLLAALLLIAVAWVASNIPWLRPLGNVLRLSLGVLFVLAAVRLGLAVAILGFGLSPVSLLIPLALGLAAWLLRPGRAAAPPPAC